MVLAVLAMSTCSPWVTWVVCCPLIYIYIYMVYIFSDLLEFLVDISYLCWRIFNQLTLFIMAVTRNNLSMKMNGKVGAYSFYTSTGGRQVARIANNSSNYGETAKRTVAMQTRRSRWGNLVSFYSANKDLMARAYERKAANISDYNRFMQLNIPLASVSLVKDDFMRGMAILQEYVIADGSLPEIDVAEVGEEGCVFNLLTKIDGEFADKTIGQVSVDLLDNNPQLQAGDQLTFVSYTNAGTTPSTIRIYRHLCEMTIDTNSAVSFGSLKYANIIAGNGLKVVIAGQGDVFGQAIIHSRSVGGSLLVSRAKITLNNDTLVEQFSEPEAVKRAINSYGVDSEKLLEPGSTEQPRPSSLPELAKISSIISPLGCARLKITDNQSGAVFYNEAYLPLGTMVNLSIVDSVGYNIEKIPWPDEPENYEVVGDITFNIKGVPTR